MIGNPDADMKASAEYTRQARALQKPLFIPLKTEYFEAFKAGTKDTEYRWYGPRWNEDTCRRGRSVVLSKGYGKAHRLEGTITGFAMQYMNSPDWMACYGVEGIAACIQISLTHAVSDQP